MCNSVVKLHSRSGERGMTLVELIVAMVIVTIALGGVLTVMNFATRHSGDALLLQQSVAIAEAYMEEITLKNFSDPDSDGETSRPLFDDVDDYNGLSDHGAHDQNGHLIAGLSSYFIDVSVVPQGFGPTGMTVAGLKIDVTVTDPGGERLTLTGYRTDY